MTTKVCMINGVVLELDHGIELFDMVLTTRVESQQQFIPVSLVNGTTAHINIQNISHYYSEVAAK